MREGRLWRGFAQLTLAFAKAKSRSLSVERGFSPPSEGRYFCKNNVRSAISRGLRTPSLTERDIYRNAMNWVSGTPYVVLMWPHGVSYTSL